MSIDARWEQAEKLDQTIKKLEDDLQAFIYAMELEGISLYKSVEEAAGLLLGLKAYIQLKKEKLSRDYTRSIP